MAITKRRNITVGLYSYAAEITSNTLSAGPNGLNINHIKTTDNLTIWWFCLFLKVPNPILKNSVYGRLWCCKQGHVLYDVCTQSLGTSNNIHLTLEICTEILVSYPKLWGNSVMRLFELHLKFICYCNQYSCFLKGFRETRGETPQLYQGESGPNKELSCSRFRCCLLKFRAIILRSLITPSEFAACTHSQVRIVVLNSVTKAGLHAF